MNDRQSFVFKFGYRQHRGTLEDSLMTKVYITSESFDKMYRTGNYYLYGFDSRCNQLLWLHKSTETWLFIECISIDNG